MPKSSREIGVEKSSESGRKQNTSPSKYTLESEFPWESISALQILQNLLDQRSKVKSFSFRSFCKKCGFSTPNYVQLLLSGKKTFTEDSLFKISEALKLSELEKAYWVLSLKLDTHQKDSGDKNELGEKQDSQLRQSLQNEMSSLRAKHTLKPLKTSQDSLFDFWYTPIVWAFAEFLQNEDSIAKLSQTLKVNVIDVKNCLQNLVRNEFLNENFEQPKNELLEMRTQVSREKLTNYFAQNFATMSERMRLRKFARVSTISTKKENVEKIQAKVRDFQIQLMEEFSTTMENETDYVALQLAVAGFLFQLD